MRLYNSILSGQVANGVFLCVDGYPLTPEEISAAAHVLSCCRGSGSPCTPPVLRHFQTHGFVTPDFPIDIIRRIRVLRYGCIQPHRKGWTGPGCAGTLPIQGNDHRVYIHKDDITYQWLRQFRWGYIKLDEAWGPSTQGPPVPSTQQAPLLTSAQLAIQELGHIEGDSLSTIQTLFDIIRNHQPWLLSFAHNSVAAFLRSICSSSRGADEAVLASRSPTLAAQRTPVAGPSSARNADTAEAVEAAINADEILVHAETHGQVWDFERSPEYQSLSVRPQRDGHH